MRYWRLPLYGFFYRSLMKLAHRFNWHYAPPCYPDGDTHLWCRWCGFRATVEYAKKKTDYLPNINPVCESRTRRNA